MFYFPFFPKSGLGFQTRPLKTKTEGSKVDFSSQIKIFLVAAVVIYAVTGNIVIGVSCASFDVLPTGQVFIAQGLLRICRTAWSVFSQLFSVLLLPNSPLVKRSPFNLMAGSRGTP